MTGIQVRRAAFSEIAELRERYRSEAGCQIVRDSIIPRGLADPYLFERGGEVIGYAGVWNEHFPGRIMEFYGVPECRERRPRMVSTLAEVSGAKELEIQTNILDGRELIERSTTRLWVEKLLFEQGPETDLARPGLVFRRRLETDDGPDGDWVVEERGRVLGAGGWLTHYNPPYADLYMEVVADGRGRGVGSYLVQELARASSDAGYKAAARCDPTNQPSRRALERGGLVPCGEILAGALQAPHHRGAALERKPDTTMTTPKSDTSFTSV